MKNLLHKKYALNCILPSIQFIYDNLIKILIKKKQ